MSNISISTIRIASKNIEDYKSVSIQQNIASHHNVELVVDRDSLEKNETSFDSKEFLGKTISISIGTENIDKGSTFTGIITQIQDNKTPGHQSRDEIIFIAKSPTIFLDDGPDYRSYTKKSLFELIQIKKKNYPNVNIFESDSLFKHTIPYSVQNGESSFEYIKRLSIQYGEWLYYDGTQLIFGTPGKEKTQLIKDEYLTEYTLSFNTIPNKYKYFHRDYLSDEGEDIYIESNAIGHHAKVGVDGIFTRGKSEEIFPRETSIKSNVNKTSNAEKTLDSLVQRQKKSLEINQVQLSGSSHNPKLKLGNIVVIDNKEYRIIKLIHFMTNNGIYENHFTAIIADDEAYPLTNINLISIAQPMNAIVKENVDEKGLGRITVEFPWQKEENTETPWIRVSSPHAGSDKGFHFIPEIGEEVLIGFEDGNVERPFMMGGLYNGRASVNKSWQAKDNNIKAISTRSGHTIKFDDTDGEESITIFDKSNNIIFINTANSSIRISAPENIDIEAKNINIRATENLNQSSKNMQLQVEENLILGVGDDMTTTVENNYTLQTDYLDESVESDKTVDIAGSLDSSASKMKLVASNGDMTIKGAGVTSLQGGSDIKISKG